MFDSIRNAIDALVSNSELVSYTQTLSNGVLRQNAKYQNGESVFTVRRKDGDILSFNIIKEEV